MQKGFPFFEPFFARLASKFEKSTKRPKFSMNNQKRYKKTLILNPLKKFLKIFKKGISKNVTEICTFSTFTHVRQITFLCAFFKNFFNRFVIGMKFCVF